MSHAPACRESQRGCARASMRSAAAVSKPSPHHVILRVKRKRGDASVDSLIVTTGEGPSTPARKRRTASHRIEDTLALLDLDSVGKDGERERKTIPTTTLYFKRKRITGDADLEHMDDGCGNESRTSAVSASHDRTNSRSDEAQSHGRKGDTNDVSSSTITPAVDYFEIRRLRAKGTLKKSMPSGGGESCGGRAGASAGDERGATVLAEDFHVVDLQPVRRSHASTDNTRHVEKKANGGAPAGKRAAPVLNPLERELDEAIFEAFQSGSSTKVRSILSSSPSMASYHRRLGDGTTALMAAAYHGDLDTVRYLLSLGARASAVDADNRSAALLAGMRGHRHCFAEIQRVADGEAAIRGHGAEGTRALEDFVYDLYFFSPSESQTPATGGMSDSIDCGRGDAAPLRTDVTSPVSAPVVPLSGIGPVDMTAESTCVDLKFEHDSDWSELGEGDKDEDTDSNSEGYYGNDYPEDEDGDAHVGTTYFDSGSSHESAASSSDGGFESSSGDEAYVRRVARPFRFDGSSLSHLSSVASFGGHETSAEKVPFLEGIEDDAHVRAVPGGSETWEHER